MPKTKTCFRCGATKPRTDFYRHPMMGDGLLGKCKECTKADSLKRYRAKAKDPSFMEGERGRGREKYMRLYRPSHPKPFWVSKDSPAKKKAATCVLYRAVLSGRVERPTKCSRCDLPCVPHGHHEDYTKPLAVRWLCPTCHRGVHSRRSKHRTVPGRNSIVEHRGGAKRK